MDGVRATRQKESAARDRDGNVAFGRRESDGKNEGMIQIAVLQD